MSPARGKFRGFAGGGDGLLRPEDRGGWFESHPEKDVLAIADSSLDPSRKICPRAHFAFSNFKGIIVFGASDLTPTKSRPDLESFGGGQTEHRFREVRFQLVKYGLA